VFGTVFGGPNGGHVFSEEVFVRMIFLHIFVYTASLTFLFPYGYSEYGLHPQYTNRLSRTGYTSLDLSPPKIRAREITEQNILPSPQMGAYCSRFITKNDDVKNDKHTEMSKNNNRNWSRGSAPAEIHPSGRQHSPEQASKKSAVDTASKQTDARVVNKVTARAVRIETTSEINKNEERKRRAELGRKWRRERDYIARVFLKDETDIIHDFLCWFGQLPLDIANDEEEEWSRSQSGSEPPLSLLAERARTIAEGSDSFGQEVDGRE
jgi:hypothetical protein